MSVTDVESASQAIAPRPDEPTTNSEPSLYALPGDVVRRALSEVTVSVKRKHVDIELRDVFSNEPTQQGEVAHPQDTDIENIAKEHIKDYLIIKNAVDFLDKQGVDVTILPPRVGERASLEEVLGSVSALIEWYGEEEPVAAGWIKNAERIIEDLPKNAASSDADEGHQPLATLTFAVRNETEKHLLSRKGSLSWLADMLQTIFGFRLRVLVEIDSCAGDKDEEIRKQLMETERKQIEGLVTELENAPKREAPSSDENGSGYNRGFDRPYRRKSRSDDEPSAPFTIGRGVDADATPIKDIVDEMRRVTVEGRTFSCETRTLPSGRTLVQFNITDLSDSITAKMFINNEKQLEALKDLTDGVTLRVAGQVQYDTFLKELVLMISDMRPGVPATRTDTATTKRIELHLHTQMSSLDGITPLSDIMKQAALWGHTAIAITDHGVVQSFPEAYSLAKKNNLKCLLGMEAYVVDDGILVVHQLPDDRDIAIDDDVSYVVFDVETTGLNPSESTLIEIAAVKMKGREIIGEWSELIDPQVPIPRKISELTHITNEMVRGKRTVQDVLPEFRRFAGDSVLVAHNAEFDLSFLKACGKRIGMEPWTNVVLDTLALARKLHPRDRNYRLGTLAKKFGVELLDAHRALDDTVALAKVFQHLQKDTAEKGIATFAQLNDASGEIMYAQMRPFHATILVQNQTGLKNLYKLVSESHIQYLHRVPRVPRSIIRKYRDGLLVGSACQNGEVFDALLRGKSQEELEEIAKFYDYLELQPPAQYEPLVREELVHSIESVQEYQKAIIAVGHRLDKPVVATGDVHYLHPEDSIFREILQSQSDPNASLQPPLYYMTTDEMLAAFDFLGPELADEIVVKNTNKIADSIESVCPVPDKLYTPRIEGADEQIRDMCYKRARELYGETLPEIVEKRLDKELNSIVTNGFSVIYLIAHKLVKKSLDDGYLVGSRGSVGSSFVATMSDITEVNPLPPHYRCPSCQYSEFIADGSVGSGFDLPNKNCPQCQTPLHKDGHDIPFETFLGFKGDKVPDIDLNFSGEYQAQAHAYTKVLFGEDKVYRAGTIATVAEKTAFGYVKKYAEEKGLQLRNAEVSRLVLGCTGIKRTTGQHPGGILVVPDYMDVFDFCPIQYPADDKNAEWRTSHFDFNSIHDNLLKLDILGHQDPTAIRMLQDLTGLDPKTIPTDDPLVLSLFSGTESLTVNPDNPVTPDLLRSNTGTYGIPEFGTKFVRQMLEDTKPSTFSELLQISGLSHGTDVWLNNAQKLIQDNTCVLKDVIGCRDDIMVYLIYAGLEPALAFKIMESVRKGRGLTEDMEEEMKRNNVPDWYIWSCKQIKYMFPKAHATAYVLMAVRIAYFKIHYPLEFYATYFSVRADDFEIDTMSKGYDAILSRILEIEGKGMSASPKEKSLLTMFELALEMTARGFRFLPLDLYKSDATKFTVVSDQNALLPPFSALDGVGEAAARGIAEAAKIGEFLSVQELQDRSHASKSVIDILAKYGCLEGLPESNQLSLF